MKNKLRLTFDVLVVIVSIGFAIFFVSQWVNHGFPLYGYDDMLGGNRKTILPFLWPAIAMCVVALFAVVDFYAHKE